ncbi:hypothetical protein [Micromonospora wenchangensis]|uniref:hypothetical protein n=1 Tax=Micromonospora wenchangensis TaxID=1185415 RepID=UPI003830F2FF
MANQVTLTFGGDADDLVKASKRAAAATDEVAKVSADASADMARAAGGSKDLTTRMGALGAATDGASTAIGDAAGTMQALVDVQQAGERRAIDHARALGDVEQANLDARQAVRDLKQAQLDQNQAFIDGKQATIDAEQAAIDVKQANLDATTAQKDYNEAVKKHGKNSEEARQAAIDLQQAQSDLKQANLDAEQATADAAQAQEDGKQSTEDAAQAARDAADAQTNLREAQMNANPPDMQKWADQLNLVAPLLSGLVGIVSLVTAVQWAWNAAQLANPTVWVVLAVAALIAVIVLVATKTTWFQDLWNLVWGNIKLGFKSAVDAIVAGWHWVTEFFTSSVAYWSNMWTSMWKGIQRRAASFADYVLDIPGKITRTFSRVASAISSPFRAAFNAVSSAWNNTVGRLHWSVPGWVPGLGGASISAPQLPKFHTGGVVPGLPGQEVLAVLQAGETVTPANRSGGSPAPRDEGWVRVDLGALGAVILDVVAREVGRRGGTVTALGVQVVGGAVR